MPRSRQLQLLGLLNLKSYISILRCQRFISKVGGALGTKHLAGIAKLVLCPALHARPHATIAKSYSRPGISIFIRNRQTHNQFCSCNSVAWLHYGQKVRAVKQQKRRSRFDFLTPVAALMASMGVSPPLYYFKVCLRWSWSFSVLDLPTPLHTEAPPAWCSVVRVSYCFGRTAKVLPT